MTSMKKNFLTKLCRQSFFGKTFFNVKFFSFSKNLPFLLFLTSFLAFSAFGLQGLETEERSVPKKYHKLSNGVLDIEIKESPFGFSIKKSNEKTLIETLAPPAFARVDEVTVRQFIAWYFFFAPPPSHWDELKFVTDKRKFENGLELGLAKKKNGKALGKISFLFQSARTVKISLVALEGFQVNRTRLSFKKDAEDTYYGMGERFNSAEHSGEIVRVWCEEGGNGAGFIGKLFPNAGWNPMPKGPDMTYFPLPFFLNLKGYGFLLDDTHYSIFDFGVRRENEFVLENWNEKAEVIIFHAAEPLKIIKEATNFSGRISVPQPWVFAPWASSEGGSEEVQRVTELLRKEKIPTSAIWAEDWWWKEGYGIGRSPEWELNRERYPNYEELIEQIHRKGFKMLSYFQPYLFADSKLFEEAANLGFLTVGVSDKPAVFDLTFSKKAQIDLTNPQAVKWWQDKLFARAVAWGVDGWMADFGEYTPPHSRFHDGRDGWAIHNEYPLLWAKANREFFDSVRPDGDWVFFVRSGFTGSQKYAPVMWTGDSNTSWELLDGLPSVIPAVLSIGISGFPITATDIAGYQCITTSPTDKELFIRWTELGAFLPVMRTHPGWKSCKNWRFDSDRETLEIFKKYAIFHTSLFPYIFTLVYEASQTGAPVIRHLALHYPNDAIARKQNYEFLLGDRVLVAPVIKKGAKTRKLYLPEGKWIDFWDEKTYQGNRHIEVSAPLDRIPIFVKSGKIIPLFDSEIDTLVFESDPSIKGFDDANSSMKILFFGEGKNNLTLWDGTEITCVRKEDERGSCKIANSPIQRKYTFEMR